MLKSSKSRAGSVTQPLLQELLDKQKAAFNKLISDQIPSVGSKPLQDPALYQDSGSGYNAGFVFPQD